MDNQIPNDSIIEVTNDADVSQNENVNLKSNLSKNQSDDTKPKKCVQFNKVDLYHFERCQGYLSIPSSDNDPNSITLGMFYCHYHFDSFQSQDEFLKFKRKMDLDKVEEYVSSLDSEQLPVSSDSCLDRAREVIKKRVYYEEHVEDDLGVSPDILCPILTLEQRLDKLYKIGYLKDEIDKEESDDINLVRESRKTCGCTCNKMNMVCGENGDMCSCFANGINCQIDRIKFPCSCNVKRCKNMFGMRRFNPKTVLDHYKKVLLNKKSPREDDEPKSEVKKSKGRKRKSKSAGSNSKRKKVMTTQECIEINNSIEEITN